MPDTIDQYDQALIALERTQVKHLRRIADALETIATNVTAPVQDDWEPQGIGEPSAELDGSYQAALRAREAREGRYAGQR